MPFSDPKTIVNYFQLAEGMTVADFGAGSGAYTFAMASRVGATGRVYAIDVQKELLTRLDREVKSQGPKNIVNIEIIWADLERSGGSKLADNSVDLVLIANLLFQVTGKYALALEAKRILKSPNPATGESGGRLIVIDWQDSFGHLGPPPAQVVTAESAKEIVTQAGFRFSKDFPAGDHHYGLMFAK